jgi:hypothetical protein
LIETRLKWLLCYGIEDPLLSGPGFCASIGDLTSAKPKKQYETAQMPRFFPGDFAPKPMPNGGRRF